MEPSPTEITDIAEQATNESVLMFKINYISKGAIVGVLATVGICTNTLSVFIFSRVSMQSMSIVLFQILAIADTAYLLVNLLQWPPMALALITNNSREWYHDYTVPTFRYLNYFEETSRDFAVWMVVLVTIERYVAIYHLPHRSITLWRARFAIKCSLMTLLFVGVFNVYIPLSVDIVHTNTSTPSLPTNTTPTTTDNNTTTNILYYISDCLINVILPVALLLIMNLRIVSALRDTRRRRLHRRGVWFTHRHTSFRPITPRHSSATNTLVVIASIFLLCHIPVTIHLVVETATHITNHKPDWIQISQTVSLVFQCLNSCINFFVYYCLTHKFRHALLVMWYRRRCETAREESSSSNCEGLV